MARKASSKTSSKRRRSTSEIALYVLSLIIILSMTIGFVLSLLPSTSRERILATATPTPTREPTATSTPAATQSPPTAEATSQPGQ